MTILMDISSDNTYDYIISLGCNCSVSNTLRDMNLKKDTFLFDWNHTHIIKVLETFRNQFTNFYDVNNIKSVRNGYGELINDNNNIELENWKIKYVHDKKDIEMDINIPLEKYNRRSLKLLNLLNSNDKILFIRIATYYKNEYEEIIELVEIIKQNFPTCDFKIMLISGEKIDNKNDNIIFLHDDTINKFCDMPKKIRDECHNDVVRKILKPLNLNISIKNE